MTEPSIIAHYRITGKLGDGGMGAVYRATDTKLNREVAIKVLPDLFAADPDRLARFTREAKVLASLNHPNIGAIHGVEERALILELIEGPTLADRIAQGGLPIAEALPVARQIAEALEYAHEKGVVHRDLKPANIKITPDGLVKVLDFGLAKVTEDRAPSGDTAHSPTLTMRATQAGVILGTAAYMAPEQARGRVVDKRCDIWAFGVVLYEILCGKPLIDEDNVSDTLTAVLTGELSLAALPAPTPERVRRLIERCLQRDPRQRLRDIGEARIALDSPDETAGLAAGSRSGAAAPAGKRSILVWGAAALMTVVAAAAGWFFARANVPAPVVSRLSMSLPVPLHENSSYPNLAISPDGGTVAYVGSDHGKSSIFVRPMDRAEVRPLAGTQGAYNPVFSPDGTWIAYFADGKLKKTPIHGGSSAVIKGDNGDAFGMEWAPDGTIIFSRGFTLGLGRVPASGGAPRILMLPDPGQRESSYVWPKLLPGGSDLLFVINPDNIASFDEAQIAVETLGRRESREILAQGSFPQYTATGHLVFASGGSLRAAPFDPGRRKITGAAVPVLDGVLVSSFAGAVQAAISASGTLVYAPIRDEGRRSRLIVVDAGGSAQPLSEFLPYSLTQVTLSRDGQRAALRAVKANDDIHIFDISRGSLSRFSYEGGDEQNPIWTPDGKRLAYTSQRGSTPAMFWKTTEGNSTPEQILAPQYPQRPYSFSPGGRYLAYTEAHPQTGIDIWTVRLDDGSRHPEPFLRTSFAEDVPVFSPDGSWIAYQSDESGRTEVYVARFPGAAIKQQISIDGGGYPVWAPSGKELFFLSGTHLMSVDIITESGLHAGKPRTLFAREFWRGGMWQGHVFAVLPDGKRFLFVESDVRPEVRELVVVLNWFEELKRKVQ